MDVQPIGDVWPALLAAVAAADEMSHWAEYDYIVVNQSIDASLDAVLTILTAERLKRARQSGLAEFVINLQTKS